MESALQRLARELTIMDACGGPCSRADWMRHIVDALADVYPLQQVDLRRLAAGVDGSERRAENFVRGLEVSCASFVAHPSAAVWRPSSRHRSRLENGLSMLADLANPPRE